MNRYNPTNSLLLSSVLFSMAAPVTAFARSLYTSASIEPLLLGIAVFIQLLGAAMLYIGVLSLLEKEIWTGVAALSLAVPALLFPFLVNLF